MTLFNISAIRCASGKAIHILPEVIKFGTVGIPIMFSTHTVYLTGVSLADVFWLVLSNEAI